MQVERRDSDRGSLSGKRSGGELERRPSSLSRDRGFESVFLQWGVSCEPDFSKSGRRKFHRAKRSGAASKADHLAGELEAGLAASRRRAAQFARRPRVYFEEWDEPMISGIAWVSELIETAGGTDIFADRAGGKSAKERIVTAEEIIAREPDIIIGSWCGKKFRAEKVAVRPGFERIPDRRVSLIAAPPPGQPVTLTAPAALRPRDFWRRAQSSRRCTGCCPSAHRQRNRVRDCRPRCRAALFPRPATELPKSRLHRGLHHPCCPKCRNRVHARWGPY